LGHRVSAGLAVIARTRIFGHFLASGLSLTLLGGCAPEITTSPNVILITLDSLTASHLGCYGYTRETSPNIDAFASQATLYRRAYSTAPWTLPTHASIMTGRYPFEHGAHTFKLKGKSLREYPLDEYFLTLAEAMKQEGFATAALTANTGYLDPRWKLDQGFDVYANKRVNGEGLNKAAFKWLDAHHDQSFFLFLNYMDTHSPYNVIKPKQRPDFLGHVSRRNVDPVFDDLMKRMVDGEASLPEADVELLKDRYDIAIANTDEYMQALFERLRALGIYDETMIVLTSDHGEFFGERGLVEHGKDVYHNGLWIPLIVKFPNQRKGEIVEGEVSSADIPRLIFSRFPREIAKRYLPQFSDEAGEQIVISENYYVYPAFWKLARLDRFNRQRTVIHEWPYKLIQSSDGEHELYDLESDPGEAENLFARQSEVADEMRDRLERYKSGRVEMLEPGEPAVAPTPEQIEELRALGYL
jgi:arylsulfatase A-like enzyme